MAWVFSLSAECGSSRESAEAFTNYFQNKVLTLSDGIAVLCSADVFNDGEHNWWSSVHPRGVIAGGETNFELCKIKRASEIGFLLYEHLKFAPPFRFAIVGWEVDGFREASELDSEALETLDGLVLSREFCERLDCESKLEPFAPGLHWRPYRGETWEPYPDKKVDL